MFPSVPSALSRLAALLLVFASAAHPAQAFQLYGNPSGHTTDPGLGFAWDNVGSVNGASGIYLGSFETGFWVMTATHVGPGPITLGGQSYNPTGTAYQLGPTDLFLFRIDTNPFLASLELAATTPLLETPVWVVGNGGGTKNWGTNTINDTGYLSMSPTNAFALITDYSAVIGEAQGIAGDSGGALFYQSGGSWRLGGLASAVSEDGMLTAFVDIAPYRGMISSLTGNPVLIPEASTLSLILGAGIFAAVLARRRNFPPAG